MTIERIASTAAVRANWTLKGLLIRMNLVVPTKIPLLCEGNTANVALEWPLS